MMELADRNRLTRALGVGGGLHIFLLLLLLLIPLESKEERIPMGAIRVELGTGLDNLAGEKKTPAAVIPPPTKTVPASSSPAPAPALPQTPQMKNDSPIPPEKVSESTRPSTDIYETPKPPAPRPQDTGLQAASSSNQVQTPEKLEGLENLEALNDLLSRDSGRAPTEGKRKFEAGSGNPVELEEGVINARPLPLIPPVVPQGTATGELEVRFVIGSGGLIKLDPQTLILKGISGNIAKTPETSEEWRLLRVSVEKALRNWTFQTNGQDIHGRVIFTILSK